MSNQIIPAGVKLAAKRAFVRTTYQAYAATLSGGIAVTVILAVVRGQVDLLETAITAAAAVLSPPVAGMAAYLDVASKGIPDDYLPAALDKATGREGY